MTEAASWRNYDWNDVDPVDINETPSHLARISYTSEFAEAMGLLRSLHSQHEISPRALALTQKVIELNPAHYTVWDYRFDLVQAIGNDVYDWRKVGVVENGQRQPVVGEDGAWLNAFTLAHPKNYQVWNYRQHLEDPRDPAWYRGERALVQSVFETDPKNFHAWSHLKWVVAHAKATNAFDPKDLLTGCEKMLNEDVYNNSVWSFRFFVLQQYPPANPTEELDWALSKLAHSPGNEAARVYAQGFARAFNL